MFKDFMSKIASGRYILTVICGVVFAWTAVKKIIPPDAVIAILSTVFVSYFQRSRKEDSNGAKPIP